MEKTDFLNNITMKLILNNISYQKRKKWLADARQVESSQYSNFMKKTDEYIKTSSNEKRYSFD